ncbi:MAG: succinate dehydrogenase cytochrome b subunit [Melioribacteraceae bacterium]|nr:succinate dehydrogenase cytochrome b subunit [Melioribacteraceae bacterium]MCF8354155.1 succinate dehydrogenase cytochrome b subunit [Melioribacteraceae bacterium]MCF8396031.1 succinate dehydrogenase cytochrome b subunit [Melioribacteraceae bacterium]MCF8418078.1 succinate dehydrogenase cytochrome b subunit [Melioribacteraceae bacterium]
MSWLVQSLNSSIGKKFVMAVTGICLILFLIIHLAGNLTLFIGPKTFDGYVHTLEVVKPLIRVIEVILGLIFIFHIFNGTKLWLENRKAKSTKYKVNAASENSSIFSRFMFQTGSIVFIFLIIHLVTFWAAFNFTGHPETKAFEFYQIVVYWFQNEIYAGFYIFAMILLGFHLNHGFQSAFQTFGWNNSKYFPLIQKLGTLYAIIMAVGFASIPIYFLITGGN